MIGLSPLPTAHPSGFQPTTVRSSTRLYPSFNLAMGRSLRFRVYPRVLNALFRLAFAPAPPLKGLASHARSNSPDHNAKGTQSAARPPEGRRRPPTACGHVVSGSLSLPARGCFSPVPHGTRSLSVTRESLALEGGPPSFTPDFSGRALLRNTTTRSPSPSPTGLSPSAAPRSRGLRLTSLRASVGPTTPAPQGGRFRLGTRSLAATRVISVDFSSSGY